jgi:signal transduction histidine kinase
MENVQLYEKLEQRVRDCQAAVEARDEFIAIAAHELRTPLTALQLQLQGLVLGAGATAPAPVAERAARAIQSGKRLSALVDGLLDVSQAAQGSLSLQAEELDLSSLCREVVGSFAKSAERAGCDLKLDAELAVVGTWDRARLEQVISHLVSNALKYGPGKPIVVSVRGLENDVELSVQDHGPGITADVAAKLFERFGRVGAVNHYAGLGLGLYLSRQIVEAHGGRIRFDSQPDAGSTFIVQLPRGAR